MRKKEVEKYYHAAKRMIQEEYLNCCISNPANRSLTPVKLSRTMICIKPMRKNEEGYVFDPERSVLIGRDKERCDICLQDVTVSGQHCELFLYEGEIYLQDLNSDFQPYPVWRAGAASEQGPVQGGKHMVYDYDFLLRFGI